MTSGLFAVGVFLVVSVIYNQVDRVIGLAHHGKYSPASGIIPSVIMSIGICLIAFTANSI